MNCIVNNNDFPGLTGLEVVNWRHNASYDVPSTHLLRKNFFQSMINLPFGVRNKTLQIMIIFQYEQQKEF